MRGAGFRAMQFNFVVSSNERAVTLWRSFGFEIVGRLAEAFEHPRLGLVDALVMYGCCEKAPARLGGTVSGGAGGFVH